MSNHSGSYMLNDVLYTAKKMGIFEVIGKYKTKEFVIAVKKTDDIQDRLCGEFRGETI